MSESSDSSEQMQRDRHVSDWTDVGREMWTFLTGRRAAINYRFVDMSIEVPRDTGAKSPRAVWKVDGTVQISTSDAVYPPDRTGS